MGAPGSPAAHTPHWVLVHGELKVCCWDGFPAGDSEFYARTWGIRSSGPGLKSLLALLPHWKPPIPCSWLANQSCKTWGFDNQLLFHPTRTARVSSWTWGCPSWGQESGNYQLQPSDLTGDSNQFQCDLGLTVSWFLFRTCSCPQ